MEILKKRVGNDLTIKLTLTDSGVRVSWKGVEVITAQMYSDAQRVVAGFCDVAVDPTDEEVLLVKYGANEPQYLGFNRLILSCVYDGNTATYDRTVVKYVALTEEEGTETVDDVDVELTVPSSTESIEITAESISSTILEQIIEDAREATTDANAAADRANTAAEEAEGLVESIEGELRKKYEKPSSGIPKSDLDSTFAGQIDEAILEAQWAFNTAHDAQEAAEGAGQKAEEAKTLANSAELSASSAMGAAITAMDQVTALTPQVEGKYTKPSTGIPESDLAQGVKDKLTKAEGAVRYDTAQSLTDAQKEMARGNIGASTWYGTQAEYDAIATKDPEVEYNIYE